MTLPEHGDLGWDTPLNNAVQAISADAAAAKADALAARNDAAYAKQAVDTVGIDDLASALSDAETAADTATTKASLATGAASSAQSYATQAGTARTAAEDARDAAEAARTDLLSQKGAASGVAPLDSDSRVPQGNLPAHLDPTALTASTADSIEPGETDPQVAVDARVGTTGADLFGARTAAERFAQVYRHPLFLAGDLSLTPPSTVTAFVYCDPVGGNDSLAGTSQATAKLTLPAAITKAATLNDVSVVYLKTTEADRTTWERVQAAVNIDAGKIVYVVPWPGFASWWMTGSTLYASGGGGWTSDGSGIYHRAHTASVCDICVVADVLDGDGYETKLAKNTSAPTTPAAGQYGYSGGNLYVHLSDGSDPDTHTIEAGINPYVIRSCGSGLLILNDGNLRYGGSNVGLAGGNTGTPGGNIIAVDTTAAYTGNSASGGAWAMGNTADTLLLVRSKGQRAANDGLNTTVGPVTDTLSTLTGRAPTAVAIDCEFSDNGDEGFSDHQISEIYIFGGSAHDNAGGDFNGVHNSHTEIWGADIAGTIGFLDNASGRIVGGTRGALSNTSTGTVVDDAATVTAVDVSALLTRQEPISRAVGLAVAGKPTAESADTTPAAGSFSAILRTGAWVTSPHGTRTTGTPTLNQVRYLPIWVPSEGGTLKALGVTLGTATASAVGRLGLYLDNGDGAPGTVVAQGTVDESTGSADTFLSVTGLDVALAGGLHWLAYVAQGAAAPMRTISFGLGLLPAVGTPPGNVGATGGIAYVTNGITGAFANNPTIDGVTAGATAPVVYAQIDPA